MQHCGQCAAIGNSILVVQIGRLQIAHDIEIENITASMGFGGLIGKRGGKFYKREARRRAGAIGPVAYASVCALLISLFS